MRGLSSEREATRICVEHGGGDWDGECLGSQEITPDFDQAPDQHADVPDWGLLAGNPPFSNSGDRFLKVSSLTLIHSSRAETDAEIWLISRRGQTCDSPIRAYLIAVLVRTVCASPREWNLATRMTPTD